METMYFGASKDVITSNFGNGFLTKLCLVERAELAKEQSALHNNNVGYLHELVIDMDDLEIMDFDKMSPLSVVAWYMCNFDIMHSAYYKRLAPMYIEKYKINTANCDIIKHRYLSGIHDRVLKLFINNELDASLLDEALHLGDFCTKYYLLSNRAYSSVNSCKCVGDVEPTYADKYRMRLLSAEQELKRLLASDRNKLEVVFIDLARGK